MLPPFHIFAICCFCIILKNLKCFIRNWLEHICMYFKVSNNVGWNKRVHYGYEGNKNSKWSSLKFAKSKLFLFLYAPYWYYMMLRVLIEYGEIWKKRSLITVLSWIALFPITQNFISSLSDFHLPICLADHDQMKTES